MRVQIKNKAFAHRFYRPFEQQCGRITSPLSILCCGFHFDALKIKNENYFRSKMANLAHLSVVAKHSSKMQTGCSTSKQDLTTYCYYLRYSPLLL